MIAQITLDKKRKLRFDMNAIADVEQATGWDFAELSARLQKPPSVTLIRACLWAALRDEDDSLTLKQVGAFITPKNLKDVWANIVEAFNLALSEDKTQTPSSGSAAPN